MIEAAIPTIVTEAQHGRRETIDSMPASEKERALRVLDKIKRTGSLEDLKILWELDYYQRPVSPEEFINSDYYLGRVQRNLYPLWRRDLAFVLNPKNQIFELICSGAIGTGKTTVALICQLYKLYYLSCLKKPQEFFTLLSTTLIVFMFFSLTLDKADNAMEGQFRRLLAQSPYFIDNFPSKVKKRLVGNRQYEERTVGFPRGIDVISGSKVDHALSNSVFSGILDEVNFRNKKTISEEEDANSAVALYEEVFSRIKSRFFDLGLTPGILCTISSKKATTDFLDQHIAKVLSDPKTKEHTYIADYKIWDVKPSRKYSGKRFFVLIGATANASKVVPQTSEDDKVYRPLWEKASKEDGKASDRLLPPNVISVPVEFESDFLRDVNHQLKNVAGISITPYHLLFDDPQSLRRGVDERQHPFTSEVVYIGVKGGQKIRDSFRIEDNTVFDGIVRQPKYYPRATRFCHVDLAKGRRDSVGIVMGCVSNVVNVEHTNLDGGKVTLPRPQFFIDYALRIRAPEGDEVYFEEVREFFLWLRSTCGYKLALISFDQYNSVDSLQLLSKSGFETRNVSVDRTDSPYMLLRETIIESRLRRYNYEPLDRELRNLIRDEQRQTVDHPPFTPQGPGSKDISDALAGTVWNCMNAYVEKVYGKNQKLPMTGPMPTPGDMGLTMIRPQSDELFFQEGPRDLFDPNITSIGGEGRRG